MSIVQKVKSIATEQVKDSFFFRVYFDKDG